MMMITDRYTFYVVDITDSVTVVAASDDIGRVNDDGDVGNVVGVAVVISLYSKLTGN